jgi:bacillolysin
MNKTYTLIAILVSLFTSSFVFAQKIVEVKDMFVKATNAKITSEKGSERVRFIKFPIGNSLVVRGSSLEEKSINFLEENKAVYGLQSVKNSLFFEKEELDSHGLKNVSFKQYYKGVPVFDGGLKFHYNSTGKLNSVNGNVFPFIKLNATPDLSIAKATTIALRIVESQNINRSEKPLQAKNSELLVFKKGLVQGYIGATYLVYRIEVSNAADVREYVFIDAHTGDLIEQYTGTYHAVSRILYEENTESSSVVWREGDDLPGSLDQWQQNEVVAAGHVYNFFKNAFGYESYDGNNAQMKTVNNDPGISCPNANWNGETANYCTGTASDDVVAHEWGHAYTEYTSDLIYAWESGALNESFSDIWGETIDLLNNYQDEGEDLSLRTGCSSSDRWKMGEDASSFGGAIRDMWDPTCNNDPGSLTDAEFRCGEGDSGGVHSNSGIPNHIYALLVDGGTYNGETINALGFTKTAHIFWRVQSVYLTKTSDFEIFANSLEAACADLVGVDLEGLSTTTNPAGRTSEIITTEDCAEVTKAITALSLKSTNSLEICDYTPLLSAINSLCEASTNNPLFIEDWESGMGDWTVEQLPSNASTWESRDWAISSTLPGGRVGSGMFGPDPVNGNCTTDLQNGIIRLQSPIIIIPDISEGVFEMTFDHYIATESKYDGGNIKYKIAGNKKFNQVPSSAFTSNPYNLTLTSQTDGNDNPMAGSDSFSGTDEGSNLGSWGKSTIDLSSLGVVANTQIEFRWELGTDGCNGNEGWYVDDIIIYNCSATLALSKYDILLQDISVYPNPTTDTFTIRKLASLNLMKAEVFDLNGRKLKEVDLSEMFISQDIDINELATGIYFVTVTSEDTKATVKLIKQ